MATEFGDGPALHVLREAAGQYIDARGLRAFARKLRMSPSGADKVVKGETQPRGPTVRKLRRWYVQAYDTGDVNGANDGPALIGIRLLVQDLPRPRQKPTALRVHDVLREAFGKGGGRPPRWLSRLKRLIEMEWY